MKASEYLVSQMFKHHNHEVTEKCQGKCWEDSHTGAKMNLEQAIDVARRREFYDERQKIFLEQFPALKRSLIANQFCDAVRTKHAKAF